MFNIIRKRKYWYIISGILASLAIAAIAFWGLNLGLDFKGGSILTLNISSKPQPSEIQEQLKDLNIPSLNVRTAGNDQIIIRSGELSREQKTLVETRVNERFGIFTEESFQTIGPTVSQDLSRKAIIAVILASIGIIIYIAIAFRGVPKPANSWRFGVCAIIALLHDLLIVTGMAAVLGHYFAWMEIDSLFITALLTIMGFSVHDTIVVFDRLRENLKRNPGSNFETIANESVIQTLSRSINTSVTTMIVLLSLFLIGGESIKGFVFTLLFGILIGTYSSILNATPLLVTWQNFITNSKAKNK